MTNRCRIFSIMFGVVSSCALAYEARTVSITDTHYDGGFATSFDLASLKGKVLLIVNTATGCGFTPQYEGLA